MNKLYGCILMTRNKQKSCKLTRKSPLCNMKFQGVGLYFLFFPIFIKKSIKWLLQQHRTKRVLTETSEKK